MEPWRGDGDGAGENDGLLYASFNQVRRQATVVEQTRKRCRMQGTCLSTFPFRQDVSCLAVGTPRGFRVFLSDPLREASRRESSSSAAQRGGVALVAMLDRTNLLALVGGGRDPRWPPNRVVVWDDALGQEVCEIDCGGEVRGIALRRDW